MDLRNIAICIAAFLLVLSGVVHGIKFLRKRNVLLGLECLVVAFSATNALLYFLMGWEVSYVISFFCDAFSRGFGIPVIAVIGMMAVTHGYKPQLTKDILLFAAALAATFGLVLSSAIAKPLPYFYLVTWSAYSLYLVWVVCRLVSVGEHRAAIGLALAMLSGQAIASIYDFYKIPGDETNVVLNFYTLAMVTWAFCLMQMHVAYCALERSKNAAYPLQPC
ncbi:hypothetical protein KVG96_11255 [Pseudomonas sp. COR58]|uniref:YhhN-like protein n=1 Tax=Pseudomonas ekonensis TaxID=2842353 RepID=A0ABS6PDJ1_9PSED|nr:hypothetical protein [Pseudomonas ekonensis]MBV4458530.1 hypothetical protein [Pseudomonas ekonensis]